VEAFSIEEQSEIATNKQGKGEGMIKSRMMIVIGCIAVVSAYACVRKAPVASCGGGRGTAPVVCQVIDPEIDLCQYTETIGSVDSCAGGFSSGAKTCVKDEQETTCNFTRIYRNCCGLATMAPIPQTSKVTTYSPRENDPCFLVP
jgi:hypothetical protein